MATADLIVDSRVTISGSELELSFSRSGGPGGQHVNTTDSRVRLRWAMSTSMSISTAAKARFAAARTSWMMTDGDVALFCDSHRSQHRNVEEARQRLAQAIYSALRPPKPRTKTKPSRASKQRRINAKKARSDTKSKRGRVRED